MHDKLSFIQQSNDCNLSQLIAADISPGINVCNPSCEGVVGNGQAFRSLTWELVGKVWFKR